MTTDAGWKYLGLMARLRRLYVGLKQEELAQYGGPGKTTVGKIENARMDALPPRTQQQLEKALGWRRGSVREILAEPEEDYWNPAVLEHGYDVEQDGNAIEWIEAPLPDLTHGTPARSARDLSDEELLAELTYRMRVYSADSVTLSQLTEERSEGDDRDAPATNRTPEVSNATKAGASAYRAKREADSRRSKKSQTEAG